LAELACTMTLTFDAPPEVVLDAWTHPRHFETGGRLTDDQFERTRGGTDSFTDNLAGRLPGILKAWHYAN
jgi:hypothetical protein